MSAVGPEQRLKDLGVELPAPPVPLGNYVPIVISGGLAFLSGMVPIVNGEPHFVGAIGAAISVDEGRRAARLAALNGLSVLRQHIGSLDRVDRVVRLAVYLRATEDFEAHPRVADGASDLFAEIFDRPPSVESSGRPGHARLVFGVSSLPAGMCVELEIIAALRS